MAFDSGRSCVGMVQGFSDGAPDCKAEMEHSSGMAIRTLSSRRLWGTSMSIIFPKPTTGASEQSSWLNQLVEATQKSRMISVEGYDAQETTNGINFKKKFPAGTAIGSAAENILPFQDLRHWKCLGNAYANCVLCGSGPGYKQFHFSDTQRHYRLSFKVYTA